MSWSRGSPYAPGAHTLIELGRDLNVVQVIPGR